MCNCRSSANKILKYKTMNVMPMLIIFITQLRTSVDILFVQKFTKNKSCISQFICLFNVYFSPNIIRMINTRRLRWAGYVARTEAMKNACKTLVGRPDGKEHLGDLGVDG
jgi:hypothetical protein